MSKFVIIAGPQAAGKSTVISDITERWRNESLLPPEVSLFPIFPLQESRQIISHINLSLGAIFMTPKQECAVARLDLKRMDIIARRRTRPSVYIDECNIFTIAHAEAHGVKCLERYRSSYLRRLEQLSASVIFLDVPPEISWERREFLYEKRLIYFPRSRHACIMRRYREYLERMYPLIRGLYETLPFPKKMIDARISEDMLIGQVAGALRRVLSTSQ